MICTLILSISICTIIELSKHFNIVIYSVRQVLVVVCIGIVKYDMNLNIIPIDTYLALFNTTIQDIKFFVDCIN